MNGETGSSAKGALAIYAFLTFAVVCATLVTLFWRMELGLGRYFDVDEYAYLYWAKHMLMGYMPYRDFLFFAPPGFLAYLLPFIAAGSAPEWPLIGGRIAAAIVYGILCILLALVFYRRTRHALFALLAPFILTTLPLPSDKFLEVRPDTLMMLLAIGGMGAIAEAMETSIADTKRWWWAFTGGVLYAASVVVMQKAVPQVGIGVLVFVGWVVTTRRISLLRPVLAGMTVPLLMMFVWSVWSGFSLTMLYSLTVLPIEVNHLAKLYPMSASHFFLPNDVYYGTFGYHAGWWWNQALWVLGLSTAAFRLAAVSVGRDRERLWRDILPSASLIVHTALFVYAVPMKHTQYLIPAAIFVAWSVAETALGVWQWVRTSRWARAVYAASFVAILLVGINAFRIVAGPKYAWNASGAFATVRRFAALIPPNEPVYDLEGLTLSYPMPHPAPCLPIGQFEAFLSKRLPTVRTALENKRVGFIYQGGTNRIITLSVEDQTFIAERYTPVGNGELLVANDRLADYVGKLP